MKKIIRNIIFFIHNYLKIIIELKKLPIRKIKIFKFKSWHHGYCYFTAYSIENKKVFIKVDTKLLILENEQIAYNLLKDKKDIKLVKVLNFFKKESMQIIVFEFLYSKELSEEYILKNPLILLDMYATLVSMNNENIIHRDIRLENFLIAKNELYIIDFSFANHIKKCNSQLKELPLNKENCFILKKLGKRLNNIDFQWNDFYSIREVLKDLLEYPVMDLNNSKRDVIKKYINKFNSHIEGNSYNVTCRGIGTKIKI